jgi:hypothetical protein
MSGARIKLRVLFPRRSYDDLTAAGVFEEGADETDEAQ